MTCGTCGAILTGTARFCASCGAPRPEAKVDAKPEAATGPARSQAKPSISVVDPLAVTAPDAFAETANAETRMELERVLAAYDAKQKGGTAQGAPAPPQVATLEMKSVPSPHAASQVSPKANSHVVPAKQPKTAAMPQSAHKLPVAPAAPVSPSISAAQASSPQARIPLAPGSSGGLPRLSPVPAQPSARPSLAPGLAVSVTWANGQRYRGTIVQLMGTRVLVVFPDGQQHWVEMSYISPA
jgi:hypothetical protein